MGIPYWAFPQQNTLHQSIYSLKIGLKWQLKPSWSIHAELENRRFVLPKSAQQIFVHQLYATIHSNLQLGYAFTILGSQNPASTKFTPPIYEIRPWQAWIVPIWSQKKWILNGRIRLEERFNYQPEALEKSARKRFALRERTQIQLKRNLINHLSFLASEEVLLQTGKNIDHIFDQNRLSTALEWSGASNIVLEGAYIWWWQLKQSGNTVYDRDIIRLTAIYKI